jgi:cyclophilin family peptidyl-prolyl cis-trans isomerase
MSRREKRQQFSQWLRSLFFQAQNSPPSRRPILVEPLETRQMMAADGFMALLGSAYLQNANQPDLGQATTASLVADTLTDGNLVGEGELSAEGEPADDLVAFAKALTDSGTRFFGAAWCPHCTDQRQLFQDGGKFLPFVEVTNPDRTPNQVAIDEGVTEYPTWEFPDGTRLTGVQSLQTLSQRAVVPIPQSSTPSIAPIGNVTVGIGSPLNIPIDGYDPNGNPLTITVTSSNPGLIGAQVLTGNRSWKLSVQNFGDMVFELFENEAPRPAERVIALTQSGFYNGAPFHRVVNNFVIQGGDPVNKDGTGGSPLGKFDDQYNLDLQHNRKGVLSYAKSTDDTGDSQFFITAGATRYLDFNHSIFGQLIEGEVVRDAISKTPVNNTTQNKPINPVIITSASVFTDTENGVVMLKPTGTGTGTATITVTAKDSEGNSTSQTFTATVVQDTANGAPFLNDIPTVQAQAGVPMTINLSAQDAENDTLIYSVTKMGSVDYTVTVNSSTGVVTLTPPTGFSGQLQFMATVKQTTTPDTSSPDDNQVVTVNVTQSAPTTIDLLAESDSGASSTDNNTNAQTLTFAVGGTTAGAVVEVLAGGNVVGTATATATTTNVTVNNVASLGQGSVLFTSRQRISGVNSSPSPALAVVLDSQAPAAIASGVLPANTLVEQPLSVDLNHADEGHGLVYALVGAPAGMTIDSNTGVLSWTPSTAQLGVASLTLKLTDAAGNLRDQPISINVMEQPKVRISLKAVDMTGAPITTVATGQQFKVQVIVKDLRTGTAIPNSPTGVYSAYLDMLYDPTIIEPIASNPLRFVDPYLNDAAGSTSTPGLIDELGAFSDRSSRQGPDAAVLVEVTFVAKAAGNPNLRSEAPDLATSEVGLYDMAAKIPLSQVEFLGSPFVVGADFIVANDVYNFDEDTGTHVLNVLTNDTTQSGSVLTIASVSAPTGGGTVTIASDGKTLNYTSVANFHGAETFTYTRP